MRRRRSGLLGLLGAGILALCAVTLFALPLGSEDLTARLRREIAMRLPPELGLTLSRASLALSRDGLVVAIEDVALAEASAAFVSVETLNVTLDPAALLRRRISPRRLIFERPVLVLPEGGDAGYDVSGEAVAVGLGRLAGVLSSLDEQIGTTEIALRDATLTWERGQIAGIDLVAGRDAALRRLYVEGTAGTRRIAGSLERRAAGDLLKVELRTGGETIRFGSETPREIAISEAVVRADVTVGDAGVTGDALARVVGVGPDGRDFAVDMPCALLGTACETRALRVDYGSSGATFAGTLGFPDGLIGAPRIALAAEDLLLAETDRAPMLEEARLGLDGALLANETGLRLDTARLEHPDGDIALSGRMVFGARTPELFLDVAAEEVEAEVVKQIWPRFLATNTRGWVLDHVLGGRITTATGRLRLAADALARAGDGVALDDDAMDVSLDFAEVGFDYVDGLPEVENARGTLRLGAEALEVVIEGGDARLPGVPAAPIGSARFAIPDVRAAPPVATVEVAASAAGPFVYRMAGPLTEQVAALPSGLDGMVDAKLNLTFPLSGNIEGDALSYDVVAQVSGASVPDVYDGTPLRDGKVVIRANTAGFDIGGTASLFGLPVRLAMFGSPDRGIEAFSATLAEDVEAFRRLGIDLTDYVDGAISATVAGADPADGVDALTVDFTDAAVTLPVRGLVKPNGLSATLAANVATSERGTSLTGLDIDATTFRARGRLDVGSDANLDLVLTDYTIGQEDSGSLSLQTRGVSTAVVIDAARADARPVLDWLFSGSEEEQASEGSTSVEIRAASVLGYDGRRVSDLDLQVDATGDSATLLTGRATLAGGAPVTAQMRAGGAGGLVEITAGDAGEALRFVDIYERVQGGELGIEANLSNDGAAFGNLSIWDFEIADEVGLEVLTREAAEQRRRSMAFDRLRIPFSHANGQIEIGEGFVRGPVAGATFNGRLDLVRDELAIRGTFVPLYALNNVFSRVPLVGNILGNRRREGLWGITFAMDGPIGGPTLRVNPLSAVAPGMFRSIFEFALPSARAGD